MADFDRAALHRVQHLQRRHDLAGRVGLIWNLPSVSDATRLAMTSLTPNSVSRLFARLEGIRQRTVGWAWTIAGAA